jgi:thioredoxin-related protein
MRMIALFFVLLPSLSFSEEYEAGMRRAFQEQKPVIVYFSSSSCPYCAEMEQEVLSDREVKRRLERVIFVRVEAEKRPDLVRQYGVFGYPWTWLFEPSGKRIGNLPGYIPRKTFLRLIDYLETKAYRKVSLYEYLSKD